MLLLNSRANSIGHTKVETLVLFYRHYHGVPSSRLALSIANFAIGATNFSLAKLFKNLSPIWRNTNYGLNRRHQRHSMSDTRAVVFHNSYAPGTETLRVTTLSPAAIFVKAPT